MKKLNVLSVDWDYLVDATADQRFLLFPDGGNENIGILSDMVWSSRYGQSPEIDGIGVYEEGLAGLRGFIKTHMTLGTRVAVADSHKHAYEMIKHLHKPNQPVQIINVDFHHDCYDYDPEVLLPKGGKSIVDCGNWVTQLIAHPENRLDADLEDCKYVWVKREDSDELDEYPDWMEVWDIDDLASGVGSFKIDLLYICRSKVWSPPHLDGGFVKFCNWCVEENPNDGDVLLETGITRSRYTQEFKDTVDSYRQVMSSLYREFQ